MNIPSELVSLAWAQLWQVTVLAAAVALFARLVCRGRPHLAYGLWMLVVLKALTPPLWSCPTGLFSWAQVRLPEASAQVQIAPAGAPLAQPDLAAMRREASLPAARSSAVEAAAIESPAPDHPAWWSRVSLSATLAAVWLAGSLALAVLILRKCLAYGRALKRSTVATDPALQSLATELAARLGLRRNVRVVTTSLPLGPAVFGLWRSTIVAPQAILTRKPVRELEPILAHELIHVRRGDLLWGAVQVVAEVLWWFHPLLWWANREACRERERCCDEEVLAGLSCRPAVYASCLLGILEAQRNWRPILAAAGLGSLHVTAKRLEDIMTRAGSFHRHTPRWYWAIFLVLALLILPGAQLVLGDATKGDAMDTTQQTIVTGQILDPTGKPVAGANVAVVAHLRRRGRGGDLEAYEPKVLGTAEADQRGQFRLVLPPLASSEYLDATIMAAASGHVPDWRPLALDVKPSEVVLRLSEGQDIRGRIVDSSRQPVANTRVEVTWIGDTLSPYREGIARGVGAWKSPPMPRGWPEPVTTNADGRFVVRGVNRSQAVRLALVADRFAPWYFQIEPLGAKPPDPHQVELGKHLAHTGEDIYPKDSWQELTLIPPPAQIVEGQVVCHDTGKPARKARLTIYSRAKESSSMVGIAGQADAQGRFQLNPYPGNVFYLTAYPADGQPYLTIKKTFTWPEGASSQRVEVSLPRGILLRGKITETPSGRPVEGAQVDYQPRSKNPHVTDEILHGWEAVVLSNPDGLFQIAVPPGAGTLLIYGPTPDYVARVVGSRELYEGKPGGARTYAHAFIPIDLKPDSPPPDVAATIQRGVTVKGRLVGPHDEPVPEALILSRLFISPGSGGWRAEPELARDSQFALPGCDPENSTPVGFLDAEHQWGAMVDVSGRAADRPLVIRLTPCGAAVVRFVDSAGQPQTGYEPAFDIVMAPGAHRLGRSPMDASQRGELIADEDYVANFDRKHYWDGSVTTSDGRCVFPSLIPRATYRILYATGEHEYAAKDFSVEPGETLQLPDIVIKPEKDD